MNLKENWIQCTPAPSKAKAYAWRSCTQSSTAGKPVKEHSPAPSPITKPSLLRSHGREAVAGSSFRLDRALQAMKPPMPEGITAASAPPASMMSASPLLMCSAALDTRANQWWVHHSLRKRCAWDLRSLHDPRIRTPKRLMEKRCQKTCNLSTESSLQDFQYVFW